MSKNPFRRLRAALLALGTLCCACGAMAQTAVADFKAGPGNGEYGFASWTPKTLPELMRGQGSAEAQNVTGHLFLPPGETKVPAVLLVHGSGGLYSAMLDYWPKAFNAAGIAVFAMDSFGPRGVKSTADDQSQVPFTADTADAFAALKLLATHPRIDAQRIAVMGLSRGGITVQRSAVERIVASQKLPDGLRFAAHIPVYSGGCVGAFRLRVKPGVFAKAPQLWLHGSADDYTGLA
jgi:dienelactone hydrolase